MTKLNSDNNAGKNNNYYILIYRINIIICENKETNIQQDISQTNP